MAVTAVVFDVSHREPPPGGIRVDSLSELPEALA